MILQPSNVELTKVHYYEKNLAGQKIPTISQEIYDKIENGNVIIKKNIFGHKWVLRVNEEDEVKKKSKLKFVLYLWVFLSVTIAFGFGIFFALNRAVFKNEEKYVKNLIYPGDAGIRGRPQIEPINTTTVLYEDDFDFIDEIDTTSTTERKSYCIECDPGDICMKVNDTAKPECITPRDQNDSTGCGGFCQMNTEYCKWFRRYNVYQCLPNKNVLTCKDSEFNCQDMCIKQDSRCDGKVDCSNRLDEENCECDLTFNFQCGENTSCLDLSLKCNNIIDCWDASDEKKCHLDLLNDCKLDKFRCNDGICVLQSQVCDGFFDCADLSDEPEGCIDN